MLIAEIISIGKYLFLLSTNISIGFLVIKLIIPYFLKIINTVFRLYRFSRATIFCKAEKNGYSAYHDSLHLLKCLSAKSPLFFSYLTLKLLSVDESRATKS